MAGQKLSTESVGNVVGKDKKQKKEVAKKKAPHHPRPVFSVPFKTGRATPDITVSSTRPCSGLSAENASFPAPCSRSGDTPFPAVTCFGLGCCCTATLFFSGAVECPFSTGAVLYDMPVRTRLWCASHARVV